MEALIGIVALVILWCVSGIAGLALWEQHERNRDARPIKLPRNHRESRDDHAHGNDPERSPSR